jgi:hypothetical protein
VDNSVRKYLQSIGSKGGEAVAGTPQAKARAAKAAKARWAKRKQKKSRKELNEARETKEPKVYCRHYETWLSGCYCAPGAR